MTAAIVPHADLDRSTLTLGGRRVVLHCHHYNVFLQRTIEDGLGAHAPALLTQAAMESARATLSKLEAEGPAGSPAAVIARGADVLAHHGFGLADVSALGERGGTATIERAHYAVGWLAKFGRRATPCCFFSAGWLAGAVVVAGGFSPERVVARETECLAAGAPRCSFLVEVW